MRPAMPWQKMIFRNDSVWVLVDESGRPILDRDGRAEMKYRENDTKSYRPGPANLSPAAGAGPPRELPAASSTTNVRNQPTAGGAKAVSTRGLAAVGDATALQVWTDGACSGNPGPMGIGVVVIDGPWRDEISEYLGVGTNNIAELVAIERGIEASLKRIATTTRRVQVLTDSSYAIGLLGKGWKAKANQELVARIRQKLAGFPAAIEFVKVAGHAGIPENERCDELARIAVERRGQ
ncbi:MAG: ribonuclease HI [Deltaproteobacteria bacterium]|nr:ribonuclease HI [Deltaproteobacteria bacterium]